MVCDGCHDAIQKTMTLKDFVIAFIKANDYWIHIWCMSKMKQ